MTCLPSERKRSVGAASDIETLEQDVLAVLDSALFLHRRVAQAEE